jgi:hypothetical protein
MYCDVMTKNKQTNNDGIHRIIKWKQDAQYWAWN